MFLLMSVYQIFDFIIWDTFINYRNYFLSWGNKDIILSLSKIFSLAFHIYVFLDSACDDHINVLDGRILLTKIFTSKNWWNN